MLLALLAVAACSGEPGLPVTHWRLEGPGLPAHDVVVPVLLDELRAPTDLTFSTRVTLPEAWRGRALTLAIPVLRAHARLEVDGDEMPSSIPADAFLRRLGPVAFRIPARYTAVAELGLELHVLADSRLAGRLALAPHLTPDAAGDRADRSVRAYSTSVLPFAPVLVSLLAVFHLLVWSLDRRQKAYLWFALQGLAVALFAALGAGAFFDSLGSAAPVMIGLSICAGAVGASYFMHHQFGVPPVPRAVPVSLALVAVVGVLLAGDAFLAERWYNPIWASYGLLLVTYNTVVHARGMLQGGRRTRSVAAYLMLLGWLVIAVGSLPEAALALAGREIAGGWRTFPLASAIFAAMQTVALAIEHARSLRDAEQLNEELRRKIEDRSRAILLALAHSGGLSGPPRVHQPGEIIEGRYQVTRELGRGGMGTVYEVSRLADGKRFALKRLARSGDPVRLARFAREAQIAARVSHPNLVAVIDVDVSADGALFLVMELVEGGNLRDAARHFGQRRWALRVLQQVASGLGELHRRGIVHRDLKPANVLLEDADKASSVTAKIADFGVSVLHEPEGPETLTDEDGAGYRGVAGDHGLTRTGMLVGTPLYMAPEQARSARDATSAADVYSFALIAHEVLSGVKTASPLGPAAFAGLVPTLPSSLAELLQRSLDENPERRPSIEAIADAIDDSL